jgi:hypothetical protein
MKNREIPLWITLLSFAMSALGLFVGYSLYFNPAPFLKDVDLQAKGAMYLVDMWAARQVALAAILALSAFLGKRWMLVACLGIYCLMNIQDTWIGFTYHMNDLLAGASFFCLLSGTLVAILAFKGQKKA